MDTEDRDWAQLAPLLLHSGDNAFPDHLHPYLSGAKNIFDDLHSGVAHDAHALFGPPVDTKVPVRVANQAANSNEAQKCSLENVLNTNGSINQAPAGAFANETGFATASTACNTGATQNRQQDLWALAQKSQLPDAAASHQQGPQAGLPDVKYSQQQKQQVPSSTPAAGTQVLAALQQQQQQVPSTPSPQQQQQQVQVNLAQLQALQQQQAFTSYNPQQLWGLQQQLWTLQQQQALIAAQQQQQQQYAAVGMTTPMLLPMGLPVGLSNGLGMNKAAAANTLLSSGSFSNGTLTAQQQAGLAAAVAQGANGGLQLYGYAPGPQQAAAPAAQYGLAAAAAAAAAANGHKRQRAGGRGTAASPSATAAAAAIAAVTAHHFGKPTVAKKQRERHRSVVSTLEAEVAEKLAQLQMLSAENEMLKLRAAVLEATVANREDQMHVISEHGPPVYPIDVPDQPATSDARSPKSSSATSNGAAQPSKTARALPNLANELRSSASTAGELVVQPGTPRSAAAADGAADAAPVNAADLAPAGNEDTAMDGAEDPDLASNAAAVLGGKVANNDEFWPNVQEGREVIKRMTVEDVARHWKQFLHDVTGELVNVQKEESIMGFNSSSRPAGSCAAAAAAAEAGGAAADGSQAAADQECSASMKRITELVEKYSFLIKTAQQLNPGAYCRLFGQNLDTGLPAPYSDAHWRRVVSVLSLSKHQVNHILACAELYFSCRAKLQNEQRLLQQQLKLTAATTEGMLLSNAQEDSPMKPWLDKLANNLKREHVLRVMLNGFVWFKVFTPVQCAKAAVYSHPFYVDVHAMVCVMCEDALATPASTGQRPLVFPHRVANGSAQQAVM